eukprot:1110485-Amphidinium_carterae.1
MGTLPGGKMELCSPSLGSKRLESACCRTYFSDPSDKPVRREIREKLAARRMTKTSTLHTFR